MTAVELLPPDKAVHGNPEWYALRRAGITASEIAQVLGLSPYGSPFSLYWEKVGGWGEGEDNPYERAGRYAEDAIAQWYADECDPNENLTICHAGLYAHAERPWQLATPDRLLCDPQMHDNPFPGEMVWPHPNGNVWALLECKYLVGGWDGWGEPGTDDVPVYYRAQCLWQLDVMGVDEVHLAAWHGAEFRLYRIRRDEKDLRVMRAAARAFLDRIETGDPPDIDGHQATTATLKRLHPTVDDYDVEMSVGFAEGWRRARALQKRINAVLDRYEATARANLGSGRRLMCNGRLVCSRSVYDQSGDTAELLALDGEPALVDRLNPGRATSYLTPKGTR